MVIRIETSLEVHLKPRGQKSMLQAARQLYFTSPAYIETSTCGAHVPSSSRTSLSLVHVAASTPSRLSTTPHRDSNSPSIDRAVVSTPTSSPKLNCAFIIRKPHTHTPVNIH